LQKLVPCQEPPGICPEPRPSALSSDLNGIAEKIKYKKLQARARSKIDVIAAARGLNPKELADLLVPDLEPDARGSSTHECGPRRFVVGFDEELKPFVRDEAVATAWMDLKTSARKLTRLEHAMCEQGRWRADVFIQRLVEHPLMIHLVRRLIWGLHENDTLTRCFRVAEDRSLADADDSVLTLADDTMVGLLHSIELTDMDRAAWQTLFEDHELAQPFEQLYRDFHVPAASEPEVITVGDFTGHEFEATRVRTLEQHGWQRGEALASMFSNMERTLLAARYRPSTG
jgi:hypothetical protein